MRKISTTVAIAVLLAIGWIASDDDTTPTTEPTGEPAAATSPTSAPDQPGEDTTGEAAPTDEPATPDPDTDPPQTDQGGSADGDSGEQPEPGALSEQVAALAVADDDRAGYDRDEFGDYDRDALLAESRDEHGCYLSPADDQCYEDAGDVHADHIVALAEAWRSGLDTSDTDAIAEDPDNLWLMTAGLNMSKSDDDPAEWLPPHDDTAVCTYIAAYVEIKIEYSLTVDPAEHDALADAAANC